MKYTYAYKTSDGIRHEDSMNASSREEVFETLRAKGIKAIKVVAADGSKANGEVRGGRGRAAVAAALSVVAAVGGLAYWGGTRSAASGTDGGRARQDASLPFLTDRTRRQVIGDAAVVERGIRTGWSDVFASEGDRFLASFAIPGVKAGVRNTTVEEIKRALDGRAEPLANDALEARELIKCRVLENSMLTAREACDELSALTRSEQVQVIGTKFVLYRPSHKKDKKDKIVLPKAAKKTV